MSFDLKYIIISFIYYNNIDVTKKSIYGGYASF